HSVNREIVDDLKRRMWSALPEGGTIRREDWLVTMVEVACLGISSLVQFWGSDNRTMMSAFVGLMAGLLDVPEYENENTKMQVIPPVPDATGLFEAIDEIASKQWYANN